MAASSSKKAYRFILLWYFLFFFYDCITSTYWVKFLRASGMHPAGIGTVTSAAWLCSLVMQPVWAAAADRAAFKNGLQRTLLLGALGALSLLFLLFLRLPAQIVGGFLMIVYILFQIFQTPSFFLSDTIALEVLERAGKSFGRARLMGSIGWAASGLVVGLLLAEDVRLFVPLAVGAGLLLLGLQSRLPRVKGHMRKAEQPFRAMGALLKNRKIYPVLVGEALLSFAGSQGGLFLLTQYETVLKGTTASFGVFVFLTTITEIPYLFFGDRIVRRFGTRAVLAAVGAVSALRFAYIAWMPAWWYIYPVVLVQGMLVLRLYSMTVYIDSVTEPAQKAAGQMLYATTSGVFRALGAMAGGVLVERVFGERFTQNFLISAGLCVVSAVWIGRFMHAEGAAENVFARFKGGARTEKRAAVK